MQPTHLRVPVGTTVTFRNPGAETFPNFPNLKPHCATQFFEGEFNVKLQPGETYQHTFDRAGEYFFNDCTDPRPTGKIEVYLDAAGSAGRAEVHAGPARPRLGDRALHRGATARSRRTSSCRPGYDVRERRRAGDAALGDSDPGLRR